MFSWVEHEYFFITSGPGIKFKSGSVNKPSEFQPLKFYCMYSVSGLSYGKRKGAFPTYYSKRQQLL